LEISLPLVYGEAPGLQNQSSIFSSVLSPYLFFPSLKFLVLSNDNNNGTETPYNYSVDSSHSILTAGQNSGNYSMNDTMMVENSL
jgi:hypothetical protein